MYLGIEAHLPDLRGRSFESGDGVVSVNVENPNEAIEGGGGGKVAGGVSGD